MTHSSRVPAIRQYGFEEEQQIPIKVLMSLQGGEEVVFDLLTKTLSQNAGAPLSPRLHRWCEDMADYLARSRLLERQERQRKTALKGAKEVDFEPPPDPRLVWWG
ncbi:MAG: hypothetical protein H7831_12980 [Magnetococcus sp. WYHC-3]